MESITKLNNSAMGMEVLYFEDAEVQKIKGGSPSFASTGPLSLLYFPSYNRFVLQLNDWRYPILRRLPIISSDKTSFLLPAPNGFSFLLRINNALNSQGLSNLETILKNRSNFSFQGEDVSMRKLETSPDDKLTRNIKKETGPMEIISETIKSGVQTIKNKVGTWKTGTKNLTSTKKRSNLKDIKNKNFKKTAHSTFKKDFFQSGSKLSHEFLQKRKENINLSQSRDLSDLSKSASNLPQMFVNKDELEEIILRQKDLSTQGSFNLSDMMKPQESKGLLGTIKDSIQTTTETISGKLQHTSVTDSRAGQGPMEAHSRGREIGTRPINMTNPTQKTNITEFDTMTHYQG